MRRELTLQDEYMIIPIHNKVKKEIIIYQFTNDDSTFDRFSSSVNSDAYLNFRETYKSLNAALSKTEFHLSEYESLDVNISKRWMVVSWIATSSFTESFIIQITYNFKNFSEDIHEVHLLRKDGSEITISIG